MRVKGTSSESRSKGYREIETTKLAVSENMKGKKKNCGCEEMGRIREDDREKIEGRNGERTEKQE